MPTPNQFDSVGASVLPSGDREVLLHKQASLSEHGREVRAAIGMLSPDVARELIAEYREPPQSLVAQVEASIISRELSIENIESGATLDQEWLGGAQSRARSFDGQSLIDESAASAKDDWNVGP